MRRLSRTMLLFTLPLGINVAGGALAEPAAPGATDSAVVQDGATALSGTPYFTANPGDKFEAWDTQIAADYAPSPFVTFRAEYNYREANVPYFAGHGGVTPPGGNQGAPGSVVGTWTPDREKIERRISVAMLVKL